MARIEAISFDVPGEPKGKGRPRFCLKNGKAYIYTPQNTKEYEENIKTYARLFKHIFRREMQLEAHIEAYYKIPKNTSKGIKEKMICRIILPNKKPDIDNIEKIVLDALNGVLYEDDAQICKTISEKFYAEEPHLKIRIGVIEPPETLQGEESKPKPKRQLTTREIEEMLKNAGKEWRAKRGLGR